MSFRTAAAGIYSLVSSPGRHRALRRAQAWIVTGPFGHFWSASADIAVLWARYWLDRAISRAARGRRRRTR